MDPLSGCPPPPPPSNFYKSSWVRPLFFYLAPLRLPLVIGFFSYLNLYPLPIVSHSTKFLFLFFFPLPLAFKRAPIPEFVSPPLLSFIPQTFSFLPIFHFTQKRHLPSPPPISFSPQAWPNQSFSSLFFFPFTTFPPPCERDFLHASFFQAVRVGTNSFFSVSPQYFPLYPLFFFFPCVCPPFDIFCFTFCLLCDQNDSLVPPLFHGCQIMVELLFKNPLNTPPQFHQQHSPSRSLFLPLCFLFFSHFLVPQT